MSQITSILEIGEIEKDGNIIYKINTNLLDKKVKEFKEQIENGEEIINDSILNLSFIAIQLQKDIDKYWREIGKDLEKRISKSIKEATGGRDD